MRSFFFYPFSANISLNRLTLLMGAGALILALTDSLAANLLLLGRDFEPDVSTRQPSPAPQAEIPELL